MAISQGPRRSMVSKATCAAPSCKALSPCRGLRPHHARKDRVGTWETSSGPQSLWRSRAAAGRRGAEAAVEQARSRTSLVVLVKRPNKAAMSGGGGRGGKGARSEGWQTTGDAPGATILNRQLRVFAPSSGHDIVTRIAPAPRNFERSAPRADARARLLLGAAVPFDLLDPVGLATRGGGQPLGDRADELCGARVHIQVRLGAVHRRI